MPNEVEETQLPEVEMEEEVTEAPKAPAAQKSHGWVFHVIIILIVLLGSGGLYLKIDADSKVMRENIAAIQAQMDADQLALEMKEIEAKKLMEEKEALMEEKKKAELISYSLEGVSASVTKGKVLSDYTAEKFESLATECGVTHEEGYLADLASKFKGTYKVTYDFKYADESQDPDTYTITLLPNKAEYKTLEEFKKDFDQCSGGGDAYPTMLNDNWLLFKS